jgi:hypothetical protein
MSPWGTDYIFILLLELRSSRPSVPSLVEALEQMITGARRVVSEGSTAPMRVGTATSLLIVRITCRVVTECFSVAQDTCGVSSK